MRFSFLTFAAASFAALLACNEASAVDPAPVAPESKAAATEAAPAAAEYTVTYVPGDAKAGAEGTSVIEITPAAGFKMNVEFPSRVTGLACPGATLAKAEVEPAAEDVTEKAIRIKVPFTAAAAGKIELNGLADFSVCNERACKLIRGEKVAWAVTVQ